MATVRKAYRITTQQNDALQASLASDSRVVTPSEEVLNGVTAFSHIFDPDAFRGWCAYVRDPLVGATVNARTGQYEGGRRVSDIYAEMLHNAPPIAAAVAAGGGTATVAGTTVNQPPEWGVRANRVITSLSPDAQVETACHMIDAFMRALKALNLNPQAIAPYRDLCERKFGFFRKGSQNYLRGLSSTHVDSFTEAMAYANNEGLPGEWRERIAALAHVNVNGTALAAWDVTFGLYRDQNTTRVGCRIPPGTNVRLASNCQRPTGEVHSVWVQANANMDTRGGGVLYRPSQYEAVIRDLNTANLLRGSVRNILWQYTHRIVGTGWESFIWQNRGDRHLFATVPVAWYWQLFFTPQAEFGGMTMVDWLESRPIDETIRSLRRENSRRMLVLADFVGVANTASLIGVANQQLLADIARGERLQQVVETAAMSTSGALAQLNPIVGLIAGAGTSIYSIVRRLSDDASAEDAEVHIDIFGQLAPAFTQFAITESYEALEAMVREQVGPVPFTAPSGPVNMNADLGATASSATGALVVPPVIGLALIPQSGATGALSGGAVGDPNAPADPGTTDTGSGWKWLLGLAVVGGGGAAAWVNREKIKRALKA